jgi:hypothetical protein
MNRVPPNQLKKYDDVKRDFDPRSWLSSYRQNSIKYLFVMGLYFHGIALGLGIGGTMLIEELDPSYQTPNLPISLFDGISAGPVEETLFFGIPFYASGNPYVVLVTASVWALFHVLNTDVFSLSGLAYGNFMLAAVSLFYSLRTWASGKGWFSIVFHSGWNGVIFALACGSGDIPCNLIGQTMIDVISAAGTIVFAAIMLIVTYLLYKRKRETRHSYIAMMGNQRAAVPYYPGALEQKRPSIAWYLVPVFLSIIGGIIMYFALRNRDRKMADRGILVGVLAFIGSSVIGAAASFW